MQSTNTRYVVLTPENRLYGTTSKNGTWNGLLGMVFNKVNAHYLPPYEKRNGHSTCLIYILKSLILISSGLMMILIHFRNLNEPSIL